MYDNVLYNIIDNKISDENIRMIPIDAPTGFGKTYDVVEYIRKHYKEKKIFFIANQLKYLPSKEMILQNLNGKCREELEDEIVYVCSILDSYKKHFTQNFIENSIPFEFYKDNEDLINKVEKVILLLNDNIDISIQEMFIKDFRVLEQNFRYQIKTYLHQKYEKQKKNSKRKTLKLCVLEEQWIVSLYPAVLIDDKKVILLSTKKFFLPIDPIYKNAILLQNQVYDNAILFIDEFDSTKQEILNIIIDTNEHNYKVECFRLFRALNNALKHEPFKEHIISLSEESNEKVSDIICSIQKKFEETNKYFQNELDFPFKTTTDFPSVKNFIFHDKSSITISGSKKSRYFVYELNSEDGFNYIQMSNDFGNKNIEIVFQNVLATIQYFINRMVVITQYYSKKVKQETNRLDELFNEENACKTLIDFLNLGEENSNFLISKIIEAYGTVYHPSKNQEASIQKFEIQNPLDVNINKRKTTYDFYQNGFSFLEIEDSYDHNLESKCYMMSYNVTPEKLIMSMSQRYKIVAISATCTYRTVIQNYDLEYFKYVLKDRISFLNSKEKSLIKESYEKRVNDTYKFIDIVPRYLEDNIEDNEFEKYMRSILKSIFNNQSDELYFEHRTELSDKNNLYLYKLYANLYYMYDLFLKNHNMHSFIYFSSFFPNKKSNLNNIFIKTMNRIANLYKENQYVILDSYDYLLKYDSIKKQYLEKGKKLFIITTYQTLGAGINMQYKITKDNIKFYPHLTQFIDQEKDFDGIYLSKPTNIFPNPDASYDNYKELIKVLYALEYFKTSDVVDANYLINNIKNVFRKLILKEKCNIDIGKYKTNVDISCGIVRCLVQAVGRICRTQYKNKKVYIFSSSDNVSFILNVYDDIKNRINNKEFEVLVDEAKLVEERIANIIPSPKDCREINYKVDKYLEKHYKQNIWKTETIISWKFLREFVLKYPTVDKINSFIVEKYYYKFRIDVNEYSYDNAYYIRNIGNGMTNYRFSVSIYESRLYWFLEKLPGLKEYFENKGYATAFNKAQYILSPHLFRRVYIAAVGEVVGKFILKQFNVYVNEIEDPSLFEKFDYKINDFIYIDFKNWSENFSLKQDAQLNKIYHKAEKKGVKVIFVINIAQQGYNEIGEYTDQLKNTLIITIPWLFDTYKQIYNEEAIKKIKELSV